jgi:hypothetical protein
VVMIVKDNLNYRSNNVSVIRRSGGVTLGMVEEPGTLCIKRNMKKRSVVLLKEF